MKKTAIISVILNVLLVFVIIISTFFSYDDYEVAELKNESYTSSNLRAYTSANEETDFSDEDKLQTSEISPPDLYAEDDMITPYHPYRLYYGEWVITEWVASHSKWGPSSEDLIEEMIGTTINMQPDFFAIDDQFNTLSPRYRIAIIPQNPEPYFPFFPNAFQLGIDAPFFVFVHVDLHSLEEIFDGTINPITYGIRGFYIKDDDTLYLVSTLDIYRLQRVSHLNDNHSIFYVVP